MKVPLLIWKWFTQKQAVPWWRYFLEVILWAYLIWIVTLGILLYREEATLDKLFLFVALFPFSLVAPFADVIQEAFYPGIPLILWDYSGVAAAAFVIFVGRWRAHRIVRIAATFAVTWLAVVGLFAISAGV